MAAVALSLGVPLGEASAQSLRGSSSSLNRQVLQAEIHDFTYIRDGNQVQRFVEAGYLVPVRGNRNFYLKGVSFPYARPEARLFIEASVSGWASPSTRLRPSTVSRYSVSASA